MSLILGVVGLRTQCISTGQITVLLDGFIESIISGKLNILLYFSELLDWNRSLTFSQQFIQFKQVVNFYE